MMFTFIPAEHVVRSRGLSSIPWLRHGFGTRHQTGWLHPCPTVTLKQIHSDRIIDAPAAEGCLGEGDALITAQPGLRLTIRTADCIPLLMVDTRRRIIAAIHAGWRGTAAQIAPKTLARMSATYHTDPTDLRVAIGPGIGQCCYEVGVDVAQHFQQTATHLDLPEINQQQLIEAGVPADNIEKAALCTRCGIEHFHSYRRDKEKSGRMTTGIWIVEGTGCKRGALSTNEQHRTAAE